MPKAYNYCKIENFPNLNINEKVESGGLLQNLSEAEKTVHSKVTFLGSSEFESFKKYKVHHETEKLIRHRVGADILDRVIVLSEFHLFRHTSGYFVADTNLTELRELVGRLSDITPMIILKFREVNLVNLLSGLTQGSVDVGGGFFSNLKVDKVKSASIFGHEVAESNLWDEFEQKGTLGGVLLTMFLYGSPISLIITKRGGIVFYSTYEESVSLELVSNINDLISPYSEENITSLLHKRKR